MAVNVILNQKLEVFKKYFKKKEVVEICINEPGVVWVETFSGWKKYNDPKINISDLKTFAQVLATERGQVFNESVPFLSTALPEPYKYRIQFVGGSIIDSGISISIRVAQAQRFKVEEYMSKKEAEKLKEVINTGKTIIIAGGTSSGKTTLFNSLIKYIPKETRLIAIEDTKELVIDQPNTVRIIKSKTGTDVAKVSYKDIINSCMRMRPDRIMLGELDIENTAPFLRLLNTGHGGSMSTVHADGTKEALSAMSLNCRLYGLKDGVDEYVRSGIDIIIYIKRDNRKKFVAKVEYLK